tara:strand:- start:348 stop:1397 length:1050 start_codon:yes stop_codon:yes gene_type:complete
MNCLESEGGRIRHISTVPSFLAKLYPSHIWKFFRAIYFVIKIVLISALLPFYKKIYLNLNGGFSLFFDVIICFLAATFSKRITLHHNSCSYLNKKSRLFGCIAYISQKSGSIHVVNCKLMKDKLSTFYGIQDEYIKIISNISILSSQHYTTSLPKVDTMDPRNSNFCIGYMGYMNREKGVDNFALVVSMLQMLPTKNKYNFIGKAVGPIHDQRLMKKLRQDTASFISYENSVYGDERNSFFDSIDVLLFPSKYAVEAEPLTVYHALERGIPVISSDIGCLPEILFDFEDSHSFSQKTFASDTVQAIVKIANKNREQLKVLKKTIITQYHDQKLIKEENFKLFLKSQIND